MTLINLSDKGPMLQGAQGEWCSADTKCTDSFLLFLHYVVV